MNKKYNFNRKAQSICCVLIFFFLCFNSNTYGLPQEIKSNQIKGLKIKAQAVIQNKNLIKPSKAQKRILEANSLYEESKYEAALKIYEDIIPEMVTSNQIINLKLKRAYCIYHIENYLEAICAFEELLETYASIGHQEAILYMVSKLYTTVALNHRYNKYYIEEALVKLQIYLDKYPNGGYGKKIKEFKKKLLFKKNHNKVDIAKTYCILEEYNAAKHILSTIPDSLDKAQALEVEWLIVKVSYDEAMKSKYDIAKLFDSQQKCLNFFVDYNDSRYSKQVNKMYEKLKLKIKISK